MAQKDQALIKRSSDLGLMLPPPPPKRNKRPAKVLDEDVYAAGLSHIIARDFFPGLLEAQAQDEYLSAVESNDNEWIMEAGRKMQQAMTPGPNRSRSTRMTSFATQTPTSRFSETPRRGTGASFDATPDRREPTDVISLEEQPQVDLHMSLGAYQAKYTSEDNKSFNELLDKQNNRRQTKYAHFFHGNKIPSARQIAYRKEQALLEEHNGNNSLIVTNSKGEERRLIAPGRPSQDLDERPASVESYPNRQGPRNSFMFEPESVENHFITAAADAQSRSKAPPRATTFAATRFSDTAESTNKTIPPSPSLSAIDAAIAGNPRHTSESTVYDGAETPRVNGYAFVDAAPTPTELGLPVNDEDVEAAQRQDFDKLLPKPDKDGSNPFTIAEQSKREDLHHRLVEKADAAHRKHSRLNDPSRLGVTPIGKTQTQTPRFTSAPKKIAGQMTPAARQLAAKLATPRRKHWGE